MNEQFTVSAIAKRTGLDRRSIERALLNVKPVEVKSMGNRESARYDRDETAKALAQARLPSDQIARLVPFGGSVTRLLAWNVYIYLVRGLQYNFAMEAKEWAETYGITQAQSDEIAASSALLCAQLADEVLASFGELLSDDTTGLDEMLVPTAEPRDAASGEFLEALDRSPNPKVLALFAAGVAAMRARSVEGRPAKNQAKRGKQSTKETPCPK